MSIFYSTVNYPFKDTNCLYCSMKHFVQLGTHFSILCVTRDSSLILYKLPRMSRVSDLNSRILSKIKSLQSKC